MIMKNHKIKLEFYSSRELVMMEMDGKIKNINEYKFKLEAVLLLMMYKAHHLYSEI